MTDADERIEGQVVEEELDPERETRRRFALAQIRQYPDAALKMPARPVEGFDEQLVKLAERMKQLMHDANGIGLAATQVGVLQRLFVFQPEDGDAQAVVNPELHDVSEETDVADEGCLSIQGITVPVERALSLTLVGKDEHGDDVRFELDGYEARCAQHEFDHLDGVLMIDRMGMLKKRIVQRKMQKRGAEASS